MSIITEEMRVRKKMCEFAQKYGVTTAARRYKTNRQFIYRQLKRFDGTVQSLELKSRRPEKHPNQHTKNELELVSHAYRQYGHDGLAEVYAQLLKRNYKRCYSSMKRIILLHIKKKEPFKRKYKKYNQGPKQTKTYQGELAQLDIKYVPKQCIQWDTHGVSYYQITTIDTYSSKRILEIVDEKSVTNTARFTLGLEEKMGFKIDCIQTDNGSEFLSTNPKSKSKTIFQDILEALDINHIHTRPYSPWQNGIVERSHRIDGERFYQPREFKSEQGLKKENKRYNSRYNNIAKYKHKFSSPNKVVENFFKGRISIA